MKRLALCFAFAFFGCQNPSGTGGTGGGSGGGDPLSTDPAVLSVEAALSSAHVTLGQQVSLTLTVKNTGKSPALGVSTAPLAQAGAGRVRLAATAAEGTVDLQPGDAHAFVLTLEAADPGEVTLSGTVEAMDGPTSSAISADFGPLVMMMESPSYLTVSETHAPLATNVNQDTAVTVTVSNDGEAEARMVAVQLDGAAGSVAFERRNGPTPVVANLKAGESQTFTFTVKPTAAGNLALKAHAFGLDANDMTALESDEVAFGSIGVERPAHLVAELELADSTTTGQLTTATLVVRNDGDALARGVLPTPAIPLAITVSGNASATASAAPTAVDVPGGSTATFTWAYVASGTGSFSLSARVRGVDQNSGETVEALAAAQTAAVIAPSALQIVELSAPTVVNPAQGSTSP
ncbi:MAG: hypothetical protein IPJ65_24880 [Archangiaceae bacterium]|nr:hypothetical protein [Archangiaceae bacterium]